MDYDKLIEALHKEAYGSDIEDLLLNSALAIEHLRDVLTCVTAERDAAVEELENYMVQDVVEGNEPCGICAKASAIPCECCDPKWQGIKEG